MTGLEIKLRNISQEKEEKIIPENIKKDISVLGVIGTHDSNNIQSDVPASNDDIIQGKEAYVNDVKLIGTMIDNGAIEITPSEEKQILPSGYHNGNGRILPVDITTLNNYRTCDSLADEILGNKEPYIELEYIEFTGTQYIDSEIALWNNSNWKIEMITTPTKILNYNHYLSIDDNDSEHETWIASDGYYYCRLHEGMKIAITPIVANKKYHIIHDFKNGVCTSIVNNEVTKTTNFGAFVDLVVIKL